MRRVVLSYQTRPRGTRRGRRGRWLAARVRVWAKMSMFGISPAVSLISRCFLKYRISLFIAARIAFPLIFVYGNTIFLSVSVSDHASARDETMHVVINSVRAQTRKHTARIRSRLRLNSQVQARASLLGARGVLAPLNPIEGRSGKLEGASRRALRFAAGPWRAPPRNNEEVPHALGR